MSAAARPQSGSVWRLLSWPLLLLPLLFGWWLGLAGLQERVEARRSVDTAAFAAGVSPLRFDFTSDQQLIGAEVQGGRYTPAIAGTTVVEPARIDIETAGAFFGLRFDGRVLDLRVFRELVLLADASCPATLRVLLDGDPGPATAGSVTPDGGPAGVRSTNPAPAGDAAWVSTPVALPSGATLSWGQGLPASLIDLGALGWRPREADDAATVSLAELPPLQRAVRLHVEAAPGCVLRLESLGFAAANPLDVQTLHVVRGWIGPGPARHVLEARWAAEPQQLQVLEPALPGAATVRSLAEHADMLATLLAGLAVLLCFLQRRGSAAAALLGALVALNLATTPAAGLGPLVLLALAALMLTWESRQALSLRAPAWGVAVPLAVALAVSVATGGSPTEDGRYLGFALLQQALLLLVLWPALAGLGHGTRIRVLAAGFALMHLPNFELSLLCLVGAALALTWYARRGDALSIVLAHALVGLWLGRSEGFGWLWGLETGWRWFG